MAWNLAQEAYDPADDAHAGESLVLQIRYALITASLNSLAGNTPPPLLEAALAHGLLTAGEVLAYAAHVPDAAQRGATLAVLAPQLPAELIDEALVTAKGIAAEIDRADAIAGVAARLVALGRIDDARGAAETLADPSLLALALAEMAPHRPALAAESIQLASLLKSRQNQARALEQVAARLADSGLPEAAVQAAQQIRDEDMRWRTLGRLSRHLPQSLVDAAEEHALRIRGPVKRINALLPLLPRLGEGRALEVLKSIATTSVHKPVAYTAVAACLPEPLATETLDRALTLALKTREPPKREQAVANIAAYMPEPLVRTAIARVERWQVHRAAAFASLAARLAELTGPGQAIAFAQSITESAERADVLTAIAPYLSAADLSSALALAGVIGDDTARGRAMIRLVPHLAQLGHLEEAREAVGAAIAPADQVAGAMALARWLPRRDRRPILDMAWQLTETIADPRTKLSALGDMVPERPDKILSAAVGSLMESWSWNFLWLMEPVGDLLARLANAGYTDDTLRAIRAIKLPESPFRRFVPSDWPDELDEKFPEAFHRSAALDPQELKESEARNALCKAQLLGQLIVHAPHDLRNDIAVEALGHLDTEWDGSVFAGDLGDAEDMVLAAIVRRLPFDLTASAGKLLAAREKHRGIPLPEARVALALRGLGAEPDITVQRALDAMLNDTRPSEARSGRTTHVSVSGNTTSMWYGVPGVYDPTFALPRIIRELPQREIDRLLDRATLTAPAAEEPRTEWMWPKPGSTAEEAIVSALAVRLAELNDPTRALDAACRLRQPHLRTQALDRIALALEALDRSALAEILNGRPGGSLFKEWSQQARDDLLVDLAALTPAIVALGGEGATIGMLKAIRDTSHWWP
jgi:hypothetical protein